MIRTPRFTLSPNLTGTAVAGIAALALLGAAPATADDGEEPVKEMTKGEEKLARLLEGRVAGEPQNCIRDFARNSVRTIEDTAYVYGRGRTIYVQYTHDPDHIDRDEILIVRRFGATHLCDSDFATTVDRYTGFFRGGVQFDQFIPYTRVDEEDL